MYIFYLFAFLTGTLFCDVTFINKTGSNLEFSYITQQKNAPTSISDIASSTFTLNWPRDKSVVAKKIAPNGAFKIINPQSNEVALLNEAFLSDYFPLINNMIKRKATCSVTIQQTNTQFTDPLSGAKKMGLKFDPSCKK